MAQLINFKDAVNAAALDPNATHAVYYMDGDYANRSAVAARCPHAKLYAITTRGATGHGIFAIDSETGDVPVPQTESWVATQVSLGVSPIVVYADQDRWLNQGLLSALSKYGDRIERWDADYDGVATLPSWASAKQYADPAVAGGDADLNVAVANFFGDDPPAPPAPKVGNWSAELQVSVPDGSTGTLHFAGTVDLGTGKWTADGTQGSPHWSGPGGGKWRIKGMDLNAPPLGK